MTFDADAIVQKVATIGRLIVRALVDPRTALLVLRHRGLRYVASMVARAPADRLSLAADFAPFHYGRYGPAALVARFPEIFVSLDAVNGGHSLVRLRSGERFWIRTAQSSSDGAILYEVFHRHVYAAIDVKAGETVLDIGAFIGDTAVYFGKRGARVVAYEPSAEQFELARVNIALNGVDAVVVHGALGSMGGVARLGAGDGGPDATSTTFPQWRSPFSTPIALTEEVEATPLAQILRGLGGIDVLKMDCEGCEYDALPALGIDDMRRIGRAIVEYHEDGAPIVHAFERAGFKAWLHAPALMMALRLP